MLIMHQSINDTETRIMKFLHIIKFKYVSITLKTTEIIWSFTLCTMITYR